MFLFMFLNISLTCNCDFNFPSRKTVAIDGEHEYNKSLLSNLLKFRTYFMEFYPVCFSHLHTLQNCDMYFETNGVYDVKVITFSL